MESLNKSLDDLIAEQKTKTEVGRGMRGMAPSPAPLRAPATEILPSPLSAEADGPARPEGR